MVGRRLAVVQKVVGRQGDNADGSRVACITIVIGHSQQQAHGSLAKIAVHSIVKPVTDADFPVALNAPRTREDEVGRRHDRDGLVGPGIAFERLGGNADAKVKLAVLAPIPWCDDPVAVFDGRMGEILLHGLGVGCRRAEWPEQHSGEKQLGKGTAHRWLLWHRVCVSVVPAEVKT